eukprot:CAMPEP_0204867386 /NCGR_PEP_ID=MMETSP1348-20121228/22426_1 /ASSEMBLY_ACC=CAM_ASM_000700 /TAXON_ID=215587 /ORGANISM="Aplanochytrium stocchinoi, Strain GSBS06" /LENGTH=404 /DNA_ID=CAMNT_0052019791 /DNA_START=118 /DNA_END=1332 /DNA_ORIENTATION=+
MFDLNVIIVGGGIAGLSTGLFLLRAGYKVHVYEQAPFILPVGAAISVWSNGVKVMNKLGLGKEMIRLGGRMDKMIYKTPEGDTMVEMDLQEVYSKSGERAYPVSRADLQQMLMDEYQKAGGELTLGKICVSVGKVNPDDADSKVIAIFDDGSKSSQCDLLIGADGIRSKVRSYVLDSTIPLRYHYTNWNGLIDFDDKISLSNEWVMWVGDGKRASVMPIADRFYFFLGSALPEDAPGPERGTEAMRDELKQIFKQFPEGVERLIDAIDVKKLNRIPICDIDPLDKYYSGRVVLIGDAAHATTPTLGQGGCQAMEDAEVLSSFLISTNISVVDALDRYQKYRMKRTHEMVLKARERTAIIYSLKDSSVTENWYSQLKGSEMSGKILKGIAKNLGSSCFPPQTGMS